MKLSITHLDSVGSTNDFLLDTITKGKPVENSILVAEEQASGKGYSGNSWESMTGKNLTFSVLVRPYFIAPADQFLLTQIISVSLVEVLQKYLPGDLLRIKWPNDIYIEGNKLAGILIQNVIQGAAIEYAVVGVGLNINQKKFISDAPNPVSMIHYLHKETNRSELLEEILRKFFFNFSSAESNLFAGKIVDKYLGMLYKKEQWSMFRDGKEVFEGKIQGIGEFGKLRIALKSGKIVEYAFKEVEYL